MNIIEFCGKCNKVHKQRVPICTYCNNSRITVMPLDLIRQQPELYKALKENNKYVN